MKNDSTRGGKKISIPPTVLFSVISRMENITKSVTLDAKKPGDLVYVIGETKSELGGGEFLYMLGYTGNDVPKVDADYAKRIFKAVSDVTEAELVHSLHTPASGGLGVGFAKKAIAGRLGMKIDLDKVPAADGLAPYEVLFSESNSRFIMTVAPKDAAQVEALLADVPFARVGEVTDRGVLELVSKGEVSEVAIDVMVSAYKSPLAGI
jgi:phosphoribosylformylglycinamidine synthase